MWIHYKFSHAKHWEKRIPIQGGSISLGRLDREIWRLKGLDRSKRENFSTKLIFYNAETNQEYSGVQTKIPANTSVVVRRVTKWHGLVVTEQQMPKAVETSIEDASQPNSGMSGRGFKQCIGGRLKVVSGFEFKRRTPPPGYVCHRCQISGHFIQDCPTNGDPNFDLKCRTAIPRSRLLPRPDGSYALSSAVLKPNRVNFEKDVAGLTTTCPIRNLPLELHCPLCKEVMKDVVLTRKCCFSSFCDKCIRNHIISKSICACGATILEDDLIPNKTLRETIKRILESTSSSSENNGSCLQDLESANHAQPQASSLPSYVESTSKTEGTTEGDTVSVVTNSMEKISTKKLNVPRSPDLISANSPTTPESSVMVEEEVQPKPLVVEQAAGMELEASIDLGTAPSLYDPCVYGYMGAFTGVMPYDGYTLDLFSVSYRGGLPQDLYGGQCHMLPVSHQREQLNAKKADLRRKRDFEPCGERLYPKDTEARKKRCTERAAAEEVGDRVYWEKSGWGQVTSGQHHRPTTAGTSVVTRNPMRGRGQTTGEKRM